MKRFLFSVFVFLFMICNINASSDTLKYVARIGDNNYENIDIAISEALDGDTIVLLADVNPEKTFYKTLTFTGNHKITYNVYGWRYSSNLTIDGAHLIVNSLEGLKEANNGEAAKWFAMVLSGNLKVINSGIVEFNYDSNFEVNNAIYVDEGKKVSIEVLDNSKLHINGFNTKGKSGQGIQLGNTANTGIFVKNNSEVIIDGANRGYVNSPVIEVVDSKFIVKNCTSNASNGGKFIAKNSLVEFLNNEGHGLSATDVSFENSILNSISNGLTALHVGGNLNVVNSKLTIKESGWNASKASSYSGIRLVNNAKFDKTSEIIIENNNSVGLRASNKKGIIIFEEGSKLSIINNGLLTDESHGKTAGLSFVTIGGGIWNKADMTLPSDAKIYNNHASVAADDIFNDEGIIKLGSVGNDWYLNGIQGNCNDLINNWYDDSEYLRWNIHNNEIPIHVEEVSFGEINETKYIKAAHNLVGKLVVKYVDEDNNELSNTIENENYEGVEYNTSEIDIENYDLKEIEGNKEGIYTNSVTKVTYIYKKIPSRVVVHYVELNTNNKLAADIIINGNIGENYNSEKKEFKNYKLNKIEGLESSKFEKEEKEITYYYEFIKNDDENFPITGVTSNNIVEYSLVMSILSLISLLVYKKKLSKN